MIFLKSILYYIIKYCPVLIRLDDSNRFLNYDFKLFIINYYNLFQGRSAISDSQQKLLHRQEHEQSFGKIEGLHV